MTAAASSIAATDEVAELPTLPPGARGFEVFVPGKPVPQGSKNNGTAKNGRRYMYEAAKGHGPWRKTLHWAFQGVDQSIRTQWPYPKGGLTIGYEFIMPRDTTVPKRSTPPRDTKPDGDKLERCVADALTKAGVLAEDSRITHGYWAKRYAQRGEQHGLRLLVVPAHRAFGVSLRPEVLAEMADSTN